MLIACSAKAAAPVAGYKVIAKYPHSTQSFTEGFFFKDGFFYEGTGLNEHSAVLKIQPETGRIVQRVDLPSRYFGEGIIDWGAYLYEWTWQSQICFVYDRATLKLLREFTYTGEGWGMTHSGDRIITSDGTLTLRFRNPVNFAETGHVVVKDGARPIERLNELEYINGEIYANVWHEDRIARISPQDGHVIGWIDISGLLPVREKVDEESVPNGIAWDAKGRRLFVTGKQWPWVFQIAVVVKR